jgi:hypothetical protein
MNDEMENLEPHVQLSLDIGTFIAGKNPEPNVALYALQLSLASVAVSLDVPKEDVIANVSTLFDACAGADEALQILDRLRKH